MIRTRKMTTTRRKKMEESKDSKEDRIELPTKKTGKMCLPGRSASKLRKHL